VSTTDIAILIGIVPLSGLSAMSYWIARTNGFKRYGREVVYIWATLGLVLVAIRILGVAGFLDPNLTRHVLSIAYLSAVLVLLQVLHVINGGRKIERPTASD